MKEIKEAIEQSIIEAGKKAVLAGDLSDFDTSCIELERPEDPTHGNWASAVALKNARIAKKSPRDIATILISHLTKPEGIGKVEIAGPGFINFFQSQDSQVQVFKEVKEKGKRFGSSHAGKGQKVEIEYVSANPTGPLHVGHGRWAAIGDSLANVMEFAGYDVTREYYINDQGSQIAVFGASLEMRYQQLCMLIDAGTSLKKATETLLEDRKRFVTEQEPHPYSDDFISTLGENAYGGDYVIELASEFYTHYKQEIDALSPAEKPTFFAEKGYHAQLAKIKETCKKARVHFDVWKSERDFYKPKKPDGATPLEDVFAYLQKEDYFYTTEDGATWFKSTLFGDDKDRVIVKANGEYTYFASDIAYTKDKFERDDYVINILGADHHGYIPRIEAVAEALGYKGQYEVLLGQFVRLLRGGKQMRMSKRKGDVITFDELLEEAGTDATRYTLISRSSNQMIDFDIEEVKKADVSNPVYYVQYAHARACSILRKAAELEIAPDSSETSLTLLTSPYELEIAKMLSKFPDFIAQCAKDRAPFRLTHYAEELAALFHRFYKNCQVLPSEKSPLDKNYSKARLLVVESVKIVLANLLALVGVEVPERM